MTNKMPIVSICMITYNHEKFIAEAIAGVLMQKTSFNYQLVIGEDYSTDNTLHICQKYANENPDRIKILPSEKNLGMTPNFIRTLNACAGKYIAFCEGDDYWTDPYKLEKQVDFLERNPDYSLVWTRFKMLDEKTGGLENDKNEPLCEKNIDRINFDFEKFYKGWHIGMQTLMFRSQMFDLKKLLEYKYARDIHLITQLLTNGKGCCLNFFSAVYRIHEGGIYSGVSDFQNSKNSYICYEEIYKNNIENENLRLKYIGFSRNYFSKLLENEHYLDALILSIKLRNLTGDNKYLKRCMKKAYYNKIKKRLYNIKKNVIRLLEKKVRPPEFYQHAVSRGITKVKRRPSVIISLTSYPKRMKTIHLTLHTLLNQSLKPDKIVLWLGKEKFPKREKDLPVKVKKLLKYGLTIEWCDDIRSYTKLVPALKKYPDDIIVTVDDDMYYPDNFLELLYVAYLKNSNLIHCHRAHRVGINEKGGLIPYNKWKQHITSNEPACLNFLTGVGGVLYPPGILYKDVFNQDLFMKLAPSADDIWFWAMALKNNIKIHVVENNIKEVYPIESAAYDGLWENYNQTNSNDEQLKKVLGYYKELVELIGVND